MNQYEDGVSGKELKRTRRKKNCGKVRAARGISNVERNCNKYRSRQASFQHYVNATRSFDSSCNEPKQRLPSALYRVAMDDTPYSDQNEAALSEFADSTLRARETLSHGLTAVPYVTILYRNLLFAKNLDIFSSILLLKYNLF